MTHLNEDAFKKCFEIVKNKVVVKTESVFGKLILFIWQIGFFPLYQDVQKLLYFSRYRELRLNFLLVARFSLFALASYFLLVARYFLLLTFSSLLFIFCSLLVAHYSLLLAR